MARHQFISDCENCGAEGVAGSHIPGQVFACFECQDKPARKDREIEEAIAEELAQ